MIVASQKHVSPSSVYFPRAVCTKSPKRYGKYFGRIARARNLAQLYGALTILVPLLLARCQKANAILLDLTSTARASAYGYRFVDFIAPVVSDYALLSEAA